jgi:hypothetical protein
MRVLLLGGCVCVLLPALLVAGAAVTLGNWLARDQPSADE